jgi:membrane protease YdiL (CAAX protease family)
VSLVQSSGQPSPPRSTVADTWRWLWPDVLTRIIPLTAVPLIYTAVLHLPPSYLGLTLRSWPQQLLLGLVLGGAMALLATLYRLLVIGPGFRRPTPGDHLLQSFYYLVINGPVEEFFFRGFLLTTVARWSGWSGWGWLASTSIYALYHRLGSWSWRSIAGVALAGMVFSTLYLAQPQPPSLLTVSIVHGFTTGGFLSWGDELLYRRWQRRQRPAGG